jgi:hypothetical protein
MPQNPIKSNTGSASVKRVGHTESSKHGANSMAKRRGGAESRDLTVKGK